ncbi:hypothetical protein J0H58_06810 [bacterium]|nr:hypothetical protein [bacterium]
MSDDLATADPADEPPGLGFWASAAIGAGLAALAAVPVAYACCVPLPF